MAHEMNAFVRFGSKVDFRSAKIYVPLYPQKRTCAVQNVYKKPTFAPQKAMSALPPKADMCGATSDVRYGP
jgi:hypothetical protein